MDNSTQPGYQALPQSPDGQRQDEEESHIPVPEINVDRKIWWIHFIFGCAVLLPWNALITATPYFLSRLTSSSLKSSFSSYLSITFTVANFCVLAHATVTSKLSSPSHRMFASTSVLAVLVGLLTLSTTIPSSPEIFFACVLLNGIAQAAAGSYLQTATVAIASLFGRPAMQAMMAGQAFVGVVVSGVQLLSSAASIHAASVAAAHAEFYDEGAAETRAAAQFFGLSTLFLCLTLGAEAWLVRMPEYHAIASQLDQAKAHGDPVVGENTLDLKHEKSRILRVAKTNFQYELAVGYVFAVTLAVFPPITASVEPTSPSFHPLIFTATHFLIFNVGDLAGRYLCAIPRLLVWSSRKLLLFSLIRTLFIPLFLMCNAQRPSDTPIPVPGAPIAETLAADSPVINSDILFFLILLLFGMSNGYVSSMCMIAAPSTAHNPRLRDRGDVDVAATLASFCLVGGLAIGSFASFFVRAQVCKCNPFIG